MGATVLLKTEHSAQETKAFIIEALEKHIDFARMRLAKFDTECRQFEERYQMKSEDFIKKFEAGELGDDLHWFDWSAAYRARNIWEKKSKVLTGISWNE